MPSHRSRRVKNEWRATFPLAKKTEEWRRKCAHYRYKPCEVQGELRDPTLILDPDRRAGIEAHIRSLETDLSAARIELRRLNALNTPPTSLKEFARNSGFDDWLQAKYTQR